MDDLYSYAFSPRNAPYYGAFMGLQTVGCGCVLYVLARAWREARRTRLQRDDTSTLALLPAHEWFLRLFTLTALFQAVASVITDPFYVALGDIDKPQLLAGAAVACNDALLHGQALFMLQRAAGSFTLCRALILSLAAGLATAVVYCFGYVLHGQLTTNGFWGLSILLVVAWQLLLAVAYAVLWLAPASKLFRRPAVIQYAQFWAFCRLLLAMSMFGFYWVVVGRIDNPALLWTSIVIMTLSKGLLYSCCGPFVLYRAMLQDSAFWQGYQSGPTHIASPLEGITYSANKAAQLADAVERAARRSRVNLLNFAELQIQIDSVLGAGGQARVYVGVLGHSRVAVKVVFCMDLTETIIDEFCNEAAFLTGLAHPNVVAVHGICVVPPTLGLVLELCDNGSLNRVLTSPSQPLTWVQKLRFCCDCVRSIAFLHSRNIVHRDIKSGNFLVSRDGVAKLADLGLAQTNDGASARSSVAAAATAPPPKAQTNAPGAQAVELADTQRARTVFTVTSRFSNVGSSTGASIHSTTIDMDAFSGTLAWAAPEVLLGAKYSPAADVYSLGIVLWEIAAQQLPYSTGEASQLSSPVLISAIAGRSDWRKFQSAQQHAAEAVITGLRPVLPSNVPPAFAELVCRCWHHNHLSRPTAAQVLDALAALEPHQGIHEPIWRSQGPLAVSMSAADSYVLLSD